MLPSRVTHLLLHIGLPPDEVGRRLASGMDPVRSLLFSVTWGLKGVFVGNVRGRDVQMRVRHGYSNGYTRLMFGHIEPAAFGTRLRVEFRDVRFVILLVNAIALFVAAGAIARFLRYGANVALGVPAFIIGVLLVVELIGRELGRRDEETMRRHLAALFQDFQAPASGSSISSRDRGSM